PLTLIEGEPPCQHLVQQRPSDMSTIVLLAILTQVGLHRRAGTPLRRAVDHMDYPGATVLAIQGTLWPTQHLDPFNITQVGLEQTLTAKVDAVCIQPDAAFHTIIEGCRTQPTHAET